MASIVISNEDLVRTKVPSRSASWKEIEEFALTFNGYELLGPRIAELAKQHREANTVPESLTELRGCLFFEQRLWRHTQRRPDPQSIKHIHDLLDAIREIAKPASA